VLGVLVCWVCLGVGAAYQLTDPESVL